MSLSSVVARIAQLESIVGAKRADAALALGPGDARAAGWAGLDLAARFDPSRAAIAAGFPARFVDVLDATALPASAAWPVAGQGSGQVTAGIAVASGSDGSAGAFRSPLAGGRLTLAYGATSFTLEPPATINGVYYAHFHKGIDLAASLGTPVTAAAGGRVISCGHDANGAVVVRIRHDDGSVTLYGHLQENPAVHVGQQVEAGQQIGSVGMTGKSTGPHLHFGLFAPGGVPADPQVWLSAGRLPGSPASAAASATPAAAPVSSAPLDASTPAQLASPSPSNAASMVLEPASAALARFDAVASKIPYAAQIRAAAVKAGIDPLLLASLVHAESDFTPNAVSKAGAMGLTQLMPATARSLGVTDPFDPAQNLAGGAHFLSDLLRRFGRVDMALAAYNAGPGTVSKVGGVPSRTQPYVNHILNTWKHYMEAAA